MMMMAEWNRAMNILLDAFCGPTKNNRILSALWTKPSIYVFRAPHQRCDGLCVDTFLTVVQLSGGLVTDASH